MNSLLHGPTIWLGCLCLGILLGGCATSEGGRSATDAEAPEMPSPASTALGISSPAPADGDMATTIAMPTIRIVVPQDGATIPAGPTIVRVEVMGVPDEELHWHLAVDGQMQGMVSDLAETTVPLEPGKHELVATLAPGDEHEEKPDAATSKIVVTVTE